MEKTTDNNGKTSDHAGLHLSDLLKAGQDAASDVKDKLGDAKDFTVDGASSIYSAVVGSIKNRPLLSVGLAFGVGYFAMRMFRTGHSKKLSAE